MWSLCEIIHIWTAVVDESEEWSSQLIFQFKQLERRSLNKKKKSGLQRDTNPLKLRNETENWKLKLSYEATHWEQGQLIEFISSHEEWNDVKFIWKINDQSPMKINRRVLFPSTHVTVCDFLGFVASFSETLHENLPMVHVNRRRKPGRVRRRQSSPAGPLRWLARKIIFWPISGTNSKISGTGLVRVGSHWLFCPSNKLAAPGSRRMQHTQINSIR